MSTSPTCSRPRRQDRLWHSPLYSSVCRDPSTTGTTCLLNADAAKPRAMNKLQSEPSTLHGTEPLFHLTFSLFFVQSFATPFFFLHFLFFFVQQDWETEKKKKMK